MLEIISSFFCLWFALKLRRGLSKDDRRTDAWTQARSSLRWGILCVTITVFTYFGIIRYAHGIGIPSVYSILLCTGLTSLVLLGVEIDITGNVLIDAMIMGIVLVTVSFTIINGISPAISWLNLPRICLIILVSVFVAILARAIIWLREEDLEED